MLCDQPWCDCGFVLFETISHCCFSCLWFERRLNMSLFYNQVIDTETGLEKLVSKRPELKGAMQSAFDAYTETDESFSGEGFRKFLSVSPDHGGVQAVVEGLADIFNKVDNIGLAPSESAAVKRRLSGYVLPDGMMPAQFEATLDASDAAPEGDNVTP